MNQRESFREELHGYTDVILCRETDATQLDEFARRMYCFFCKLVGGDEAFETEPIYTTFGNALSPKSAGQCITDSPRTTAFLRGLRDAIRECRSRHPTRPVRVLYAGCGPFAALATPLTTQFSPNEVKFKVLDLHDNALECLRVVIESLDIEEYFAERSVQDATIFQYDGAEFDIIVVEAMNRALLREPHAAITANLGRQRGPESIFLPQRVTISAALQPAESNMPDAERYSTRVRLGTVLELTPDSFKHFRDHDDLRAVLAVNRTFTLPHMPTGKLYEVVLCTRVDVFQDHAVPEDASVITMAQPVPSIDPEAIRSGMKIRITYMLGELI